MAWCCLLPQVELPNLEEEEGAGLSEDEGDQFEVELEPATAAAAAAPVSGKGSTLLGLHYSQKRVMKNEQAEKLDVMMTICLEHFNRLCHRKGEAFDTVEPPSRGHTKATHTVPCREAILFSEVRKGQEKYSGICANSHLIWQVTLYGISPKVHPLKCTTNLYKQATSVQQPPKGDRYRQVPLYMLPFLEGPLYL